MKGRGGFVENLHRIHAATRGDRCCRAGLRREEPGWLNAPEIRAIAEGNAVVSRIRLRERWANDSFRLRHRRDIVCLELSTRRGCVARRDIRDRSDSDSY